ncbi:MAG: nucleotidyltransferase domain-containing protein [Thermodesulfovibrionales bacterium]
MLIPKKIEPELQGLQEKLEEKLGKNLICLILYGSWAKGTARDDSDIDMLVVLDKLDDDVRRTINEVEKEIETEIEPWRSITLVPAIVEEFKLEKIPLFTVIKREGLILHGNIDLTINPEMPHIKYAEYFEKSREFESRKVEMAEEILRDHPDFDVTDLCFIASKHAIQMALAMKGRGYSSKVSVLLPLAGKYIDEGTAERFKRLFDLYVKSEYRTESLTAEEAKACIEHAKEILKVCYSIPSK